MPQPTLINNQQQVPSQLPIYSDVADAFYAHPITGDVVLVTGIQSIVQSVMNLVNTNHWDVPFHGEIGGNVRRLLFELADSTTAALLAQEITDVLANFEPRATNVNVSVTAGANENGWDVVVQFEPAGGGTIVSVAFFLYRTR